MAQLAQLNIAKMRYAEDDPAFAAFVDALDPVNASAETSPGFVWRLESDASDSDALAAFEARGWLVNMSVWESLQDLKNFIRSPLHLAVMQRRAEWFEKVEVYLCLWWVRDGEIPTFDEAVERLDHLKRQGPSPFAFNFARTFESTA